VHSTLSYRAVGELLAQRDIETCYEGIYGRDGLLSLSGPERWVTDRT
jgi:hypothetical protein